MRSAQQLIPADQDPGAKEAGVVNYIDIQLSKPVPKAPEGLPRGPRRRSISAVAANSARRFVELAAEQQIEVLNSVEENSKVFFELHPQLTRARASTATRVTAATAIWRVGKCSACRFLRCADASTTTRPRAG